MQNALFALQRQSQSSWRNYWSLKFHFKVLSITPSVVTMATEQNMRPALPGSNLKPLTINEFGPEKGCGLDGFHAG